VKLFETIESLPRSARLPLLDLAMPALKLMSADQGTALLAVVHRLIEADQRISQTEFVLQAVLERRLASRAGRAVAVRYLRLTELKQETALLALMMARTTADQGGAKAAFMRAAIGMPDLALSEQDFVASSGADFFEVKQALAKLNQLAPLAKPFLIRLLLAAAGTPMTLESADFLRGVCAAIDAPVPEQVAQTYTQHHWNYS
jgi:hypothetical protein